MVKQIHVGLKEIDSLDMKSINQVLVDCSCDAFPRTNHVNKAPHEFSMVQAITRFRWRALHLARKPRIAGPRGVFLAWFHFTRYRALRKQANKASALARRQQFDDLLHQAETFAMQNNTHRLFSAIRLLAPKQRYKRVQLYGNNGQMLSKDQEVDALRTHFCGVFQGDPLNEVVHADSPCVPFSVEEVECALAVIPQYKATPKHMAPGPVWQAAKATLAQIIAPALATKWSGTQPDVPQNWKDGWLTLFCKPSKPGRVPSDFRPISLQDPVGKAVLTLVAKRVRSVICAYAADCPQHAYLPRRSTEGALLWIFHRCRMIRDLAVGNRRTIYDIRAGKVASPFSGGLILSLDMSQAFDAIPRRHIQAALLEAGVATSDVVLIMNWLQGSEYHVEHGGVRLSILTDRGVRQGCVLSPLIWSCFTCYVAKRLPSALSSDDLQMYADDFLQCTLFSDLQSFHKALRAISVLFEHLRGFGLKLNMEKTALLIRMAHPTGQQELRKHLVHNHKGSFLSAVRF